MIVASSTTAAADLDCEAGHSIGVSWRRYHISAAAAKVLLLARPVIRGLYVDRLTEVGPRPDSTAEMRFEETAPPPIPKQWGAGLFAGPSSVSHGVPLA